MKTLAYLVASLAFLLIAIGVLTIGITYRQTTFPYDPNNPPTIEPVPPNNPGLIYPTSGD